MPVKLEWQRVDTDRWRSTCGSYEVWVQARVREGASVVKGYAAQYKNERPWLCESGTFVEAKGFCQDHANGITRSRPW